MAKIEIYTKNLCGFCDKAKNLLSSKNLKYIEYNIFDDPNYLEIMLKKSNGYKTMPQIFINDKHIGGFNELVNIIKNGKFDQILNS